MTPALIEKLDWINDLWKDYDPQSISEIEYIVFCEIPMSDAIAAYDYLVPYRSSNETSAADIAIGFMQKFKLIPQ